MKQLLDRWFKEHFVPWYHRTPGAATTLLLLVGSALVMILMARFASTAAFLMGLFFWLLGIVIGIVSAIEVDLRR